MEKEIIEKNIFNIQKKLQELDSSFQNIEQDLEQDVSNINKSVISKKSKYTKNESIHISPNNHQRSRFQTQGYENPSNLDINNNQYYNPENYTKKSYAYNNNNQNYNNTNYQNELKNDINKEQFENLINEIDELKENIREKDLNIETLNFRYEKIQSELTIKLNTINKLSIEMEDKNSIIKKYVNSNKHLQSVIDGNKNNLLPDHQKLKSQYEILFLEMKSLENDNNILEKRLKDLSEINLLMKNENRELKNSNYKIELERLENKKNLEVLKNNMGNIENDFFDVSEKNEILSVENERLKNELLTLTEKIKIFDKFTGVKNKNEVNKIKNDFKFELSSNLNYLPQNQFLKSEKKFTREKISNNFDFEKSFNIKKVVKKSNLMENIDRLDFSDIDMLGEKLKKVSQ